MQFKVTYLKLSEKDTCPMIEIRTAGTQGKEDFGYSALKSGHGIQVNDPTNEVGLMKMCDKIAKAVYEYQEGKENG